MDSSNLATSPTKLLPPYIKRHGHKRSSAISGDFDINNGMSIFLNSPSTIKSQQQLSQSVPLDESFILQKLSDSNKTPPLQQIPQIQFENTPISSINFNNNSPYTPSVQQSQDKKSTKFYITDETKFDKFTDIPDALINLDDILTTPKSQTKHKRTESAPLDFNGFTIQERFLTSPVRNEVVVEEDEDNDDESVSSNLMTKLYKAQENSESSSLNSILSNSSSSLNKNISHKQSVTSLRGKAARYQTYYQNQQKVGCLKSNSVKSPLKQRTKVFKFESVSYDIPDEKPPQLIPLPSRSSSPLKNEVVLKHKHERSKSLQSTHSPVKDKIRDNKPSKLQSHKKSNSLFGSISKIHLRKSSNKHMSLSSTSSSSSSIIFRTTNEDLIHYPSSPSPKPQQRLIIPLMSPVSSNSSINDSTLTTHDLTLMNLGEPGPMIFHPVPVNTTTVNTDIINVMGNTHLDEKENKSTRHSKKNKHRWWFKRK